MSDLRIGQGVDVHAFEENKPLVLGGITIPYPLGMKAHSDGDVVIHALCDGLLGALSLGDIGQHFPDADATYDNVDSKKLLASVWRLIAERKYKLCNADITLVAQKPKLASHIPAMRSCLAHELGVELAQISIKATTSEKLGFTGREEGIAAMAVVLLQKVSGDRA